MSNSQNSRRDFIKMMSAAAVAPLLTMPGAKAFAQSKAPLRMLTLIDTYGIPLETRNTSWVNVTTGDYALSEANLGSILKPLAAYIDNLLVISNIELSSRASARDSKTHHYLTPHTLAGSGAMTRESGEALFTLQHASVDVHIGQYLSSAQYGLTSPRVYDHLYFSDYAEPTETTFCYSQDGIQKRSIAGALNIRNSLFTDTTSINFGLSQRQNKLKIDALSLIKGRVTGVNNIVNNSNKEDMLNYYQESLDNLSREIDLKDENIYPVPTELLTDVVNGGKSDASHIGTMFKNIYHAFAYDLASSITYSFGGEKINQLRYSYLYDAEEHNDEALLALISKNFHAPSHQTDEVASKCHELVRIHQSQELAILIDRLSATIDTDGSTLLDNTVIYFTSQMSNNTHSTEDYALFVIAGKNTRLQGGYHYDLSTSTNNDLLTTLTQSVGMTNDNFGGHNSSGVYDSSLQNGAISKMLKS